MIEAATGVSYYDLLQERILVPQKLSQIRPQDQVATGITVAVQTNQDDRTDMIGLITRVAELAAQAN